MTATIEQRVQAGAEWLDQNQPGWWHTINLDHLDIANPWRCVIGQTWNTFYQLPAEATAQGYGFDASDQATRDGTEVAELAALTDAWRALIEERRSGVPA